MKCSNQISVKTKLGGLMWPCHKAKTKMIVFNWSPIMIDRGGKIQMVNHFIWFTFSGFWMGMRQELTLHAGCAKY
jgi:hypothetical protein